MINHDETPVRFILRVATSSCGGRLVDQMDISDVLAGLDCILRDDEQQAHRSVWAIERSRDFLGSEQGLDHSKSSNQLSKIH